MDANHQSLFVVTLYSQKEDRLQLVALLLRRPSKPDRLKSWCGNCRIFVAPAFRGCGKTPKLSFRGRGLPEESAFFLVLVKKQIPRCARDDKIADFFRSLFSPWPARNRDASHALHPLGVGCSWRGLALTSPHRLKPAPLKSVERFNLRDFPLMNFGHPNRNRRFGVVHIDVPDIRI